MFQFEKFPILCVAVIILAGVLQKFWSTPLSFVTSIASEYDFIIVGGGTAGCVLAARLSEDPTQTVLLVEAGDQFGYASKVPIMPTILQRGANDWSFMTEPQKYSSFGLNEKIQFLPRGKGLGGSGQMNYMLHGMGLPLDFDKWAEMGALGWDYSNIEPIVKKIFISDDTPQDSSFFSTKSAPMIRLSDIDKSLDSIKTNFLKATTELPEKIKLDVSTLRYTISNGQRESSFKSHLLPNLNRINLHVLKNCLVTKIIFSGKDAEAIEIQNNEHLVRVFAFKEIVLSSGSLKTPQLLMLSGIGPKNLLEKLAINPIFYSEGVGENLHDHLNMPLYISINEPISMTLNKITNLDSMFSYFLKGKGFIASPGVLALGRGENDSAIILFAMGSVDEVILREIANFKPEVFHSFFPFYKDSNKEGFILLNTCLQPSSRGTVNLRTTDPTQPPIIDPNYLSNIQDIECMIRAIRLSMEVLNTPTFRKLGAILHWPLLDGCIHLWDEMNITDDYLECIIRFGALTGHHAAGTCSMAGESAVVDPSLLVKGVGKLSIVDASIFPTPVSSPPNSVIVIVAERAADMIKTRHNIQPATCKSRVPF